MAMEVGSGDAWIYLGRRNRIDFSSGLRMGGDRNRRDQVGEI